MTIVYLKPTATGTGLGTDWDNASTMASFATIYTAAMPGDQIWLSSVGTHVKAATTTLTNANDPTAALPIRVRGMRPYGTVQGFPEKAIIIGNRTAPWPQVYGGGATAGGTLFLLSTGAKHTWFDNLIVMNHDIGIKLNVTDNVGIKIEDYEAMNVRAGFSCGVTTSALRIRRAKVLGFTLYGVYVAGDSSDIVVEDSQVYQLGFDDNDTGNTGEGFMLDVTAHSVRFRRCIAVGGFDIRPDANYWQGEGFASEEGNDDVIWEDCYSAWWADAGWDTKASNGILRRCVAEHNTRNFRFWDEVSVAEDCISRYPSDHGGSSSPAHIWLGATAGVQWRSTVGRSLIEDHDPVIPIVNNAGATNAIAITDALLRKHTDALLQTGTTATFVNCLTETET